MNTSLLSPSLAVTEFILIANELEKETRRYSERPDAKQSVLDRRNNQLSRFYRAVETLQTFAYLDVWEQIESEFASLIRYDPSLDALDIRIQFKADACRSVSFSIDLFERL